MTQVQFIAFLAFLHDPGPTPSADDLVILALTTVDIVRLAIFVTLIFILLFGGICIGWLSHLSKKTHKDVVDIDQRLSRLENHVDTDGDSSLHQ
jgi:hypothetical protein